MSGRLLALSHCELMGEHKDLSVLPPPLPPRQAQQRQGTGDNQEDQLQARKPKIIPCPAGAGPSGQRSVRPGNTGFRHPQDLNRAIALHEQILADSTRILGNDHPGTLSCRNNLAYAHRLAGDLDRAIPLFEQTLADRQRVLGPDHPDTLTTRSNLANACHAGGTWAAQSPCTSKPSLTCSGS